jgi:hypothetical protein
MKPAPPFTSEQTVFGHGIYLVAVALGLFLAPGLVRVLLPFSPEVDWWNRILALPVLNLGILCIGVAWIRSRLLMKLTAATRLLVMASIGILVACTRHRRSPLASASSISFPPRSPFGRLWLSVNAVSRLLGDRE